MSVKVEFTYPLAPITVTHSNGRTSDWEVDSRGEVSVCFEVPDDLSIRSNATVERYVTLSAEDWRAVVDHVAADLAKVG